MERTFEESLGDLEKIVKQLEDGDLPLDQSLKLFEEGVKLSRLCRERLSRAERRIELLTKEGDSLVVESFAGNSEEIIDEEPEDDVIDDDEEFSEDDLPF